MLEISQGWEQLDYKGGCFYTNITAKIPQILWRTSNQCTQNIAGILGGVEFQVVNMHRKISL